MPPDKIITMKPKPVEEGARILRISRKQMSNLIRKKGIPTVRLNSAVVLLDIKEVDKFIREHPTLERTIKI